MFCSYWIYRVIPTPVGIGILLALHCYLQLQTADLVVQFFIYLYHLTSCINMFCRPVTLVVLLVWLTAHSYISNLGQPKGRAKEAQSIHGPLLESCDLAVSFYFPPHTTSSLLLATVSIKYIFVFHPLLNSCPNSDAISSDLLSIRLQTQNKSWGNHITSSVWGLYCIKSASTQL